MLFISREKKCLERNISYDSKTYFTQDQTEKNIECCEELRLKDDYLNTINIYEMHSAKQCGEYYLEHYVLQSDVMNIELMSLLRIVKALEK